MDLLTAIGVAPDGMLGHSVGELGCAYADGTFTAEQTVLAAYWRGRSILESKLPPGAMAAVGQCHIVLSSKGKGCLPLKVHFLTVQNNSVLIINNY